MHTPIGVDIGAVSPEEISLSIMADITATKHGKHLPHKALVGRDPETPPNHNRTFIYKKRTRRGSATWSLASSSTSLPSPSEDATALLKKHGSDAKVLAGGMSLLPVMKLRLGSPAYIVDINRITGMEYIKRSGGNILVGALARHHDLRELEAHQGEGLHARRVRGTDRRPSGEEHGNDRRLALPLRPERRLGCRDPCGEGPGKDQGSLEGEDDEDRRFSRRHLHLCPEAERAPDRDQPSRFPSPGAAERTSSWRGGRETLPRRPWGCSSLSTRAGRAPTSEIGLTALGSKNLRASKAEAALLGKPLTSRVDRGGGRGRIRGRSALGGPPQGFCGLQEGDGKGLHQARTAARRREGEGRQ